MFVNCNGINPTLSLCLLTKWSIMDSLRCNFTSYLNCRKPCKTAVQFSPYLINFIPLTHSSVLSSSSSSFSSTCKFSSKRLFNSSSQNHRYVFIVPPKIFPFLCCCGCFLICQLLLQPGWGRFYQLWFLKKVQLVLGLYLHLVMDSNSLI